MPKVYHRTKVYRTQFRKLALHAPFWLATNLATAPSIKYGRTNAITGWNTTTGALTLTPQADVSAQCVKVPDVFMGQVLPNAG